MRTPRHGSVLAQLSAAAADGGPSIAASLLSKGEGVDVSMPLHNDVNLRRHGTCARAD